MRAFYGGVLGMTEIGKPEPLRARGGAWFRAGSAEVHVGIEEGFRPSPKAHPGFAVPDVEALAVRVAGAGAEVIWDEHIPGLRRFHTKDPVGNRLEFQQGWRLTDTLRIEPCTEEVLADLEASMPAGPAHRAHLADQRRGSTTYLVARRGGVPVGTAVVAWRGCHGPNARTAYPDAVEISNLQVRSDSRGNGLGTALILDAEARILARGRIQVAVGVAEDNVRAAALYQRLGYQPTPVTDVFEYEWTDAVGTARHEVETTTLLVRRLEPRD